MIVLSRLLNKLKSRVMTPVEVANERDAVVERSRALTNELRALKAEADLWRLQNGQIRPDRIRSTDR